LYLRVPKWCGKAELVSEQDFDTQSAGNYLIIDRRWKDGDAVTLRLPMETGIRRWEQNGNVASVDRGPLTYSLQLGEKWEKYGGSEQWPEWQVTPQTPWNYGLVLDEKEPARAFEVVKKQWDGIAKPANSLDRYDIELKAKAKKIPNWVADEKGVAGELQPSPVKSDERVETVTLIPMGAARLRISAFPVIGSGAGAREWKKPAKSPVSASHVNPGDTVGALIDGWEPKNSADTSLPRFTWWDHKGTVEWVQYDFDNPRKLTKSSVYWFDDRAAGGGCRVPERWGMFYRDVRGSEEWKPLRSKGRYPTPAPDKFNVVELEPVEATAVRLQVQLQKGYSGGILEWRVE
jgi:hypothetical protein